MTEFEADLIIREIKPIEYSFLNEMLYQAIFVADETVVLPREIIEQPDLKQYIQDFGKEGDFCLVSEHFGFDETAFETSRKLLMSASVGSLLL